MDKTMTIPSVMFIFLFATVISNTRVECSVNMFLDKTEVYRLLGVPSEISYINAGIIHPNALDDPLNVSAAINIIHFTWESLDSSFLVPYTRDVEVSDKKVLSISMNIADSGTIPPIPETVIIEFNCNGIDAEILVHFNFVLFLNPKSNTTTPISFHRRKFCSTESQKMSYELDQEPIASEGFDSSQLSVFYIVLCLGCSLITLLVVCFMAYIVTSKKQRPNSLHTEQQIRLSTGEPKSHQYIGAGVGINSGTSTSSNMSHNSSKRNKNYTPLDNRSLDLLDRIAEISIERKRVRLQKIELEGTFGRVFNGTYTKEDGSEESVLVKTVMDFACSTQISLLLREGLTLYGLKHRNIMSVLGVSIEDHSEPFVIYLREGYSNLKKFLQKCKLCPEGIAHTLTTQEVVQIALQIISGVQYMHKKKLLHKDLATRNCLIDGMLNVKISDNALSRDLFPNDYHCLGDNENRPVKWLSIESLIYKTFSTASDVWAFGVTLWELTTLAQQPYVEVDPFEIEHYLKDGYRLSQPVNCPDELFAVMAYCWAMSPDERPTFSQLLTCLQDFHNQLDKYV